MRNIKEDVIKNKPVRKCGGKFYYFDEDGIYRCILEKELDESLKVKWNYMRFQELYTYYKLGIKFSNLNLVKKAISKLKVGDTLEVFDEYLSNITFEKHKKPENLDRFITKINNPIFHRTPENLNKDTFDYIFIDVMILTEWEEDRISYIYKNKNEILKRVIEKLESNKKFQKYGVPINFLKVSRITLKRDSVLEFILELKNI